MNGTYPWSFVASTYPLRTFGSSSFLVSLNSLSLYESTGVEYIHTYLYAICRRCWKTVFDNSQDYEDKYFME